jgi:co-chaperonin GroES (HSP10)
MEILNKFIMLERVYEKKTSSSGLIMSDEDSNEMRYQRGNVRDVGFHVLGIKGGDTIIFDKVSAYDVLIGDERLTIIQEKDVACVL